MSLIRTSGGLRAFPRTSFIDDFFNTEWPVFDWDGKLSDSWVPAANVKEGEKEFAVELSVPGYAKKDIHVEVDSNNVLRITGERQEEAREESENYTRREFSYGSFSRSFQLPEAINDDKISAKCKDGVLKVELPKKETAILKEKVKEIEVA